MIFGNSILHGIGASTPANGCSALFAAAIGGSVTAYGNWVGTSFDLSANLGLYLVGTSPDVVLVHTATRDAETVSVADVVATTASNTARIAAAWPASKVLVLGPWGPASDLNTALPGAMQGGAVYVPLVRIFMNEANRVPDGQDFAGHPNDAGHAAIARTVLASLPPLPAQPTPTPVPTATPQTWPLPSLQSGWQRGYFPNVRRRV